GAQPCRDQARPPGVLSLAGHGARTAAALPAGGARPPGPPPGFARRERGDSRKAQAGLEGAMTILGIDHVQLAIPPGGEEQARAFYGGVLGLEELPKPEAMRARGGLWFAGGIHLGIEPGMRP